MKRTIIAIAMATLLTSPAISDEFMHKETGRILDAMENDEATNMYISGFARGVEWACTVARGFQIKKTENQSIDEFILEKLRNERRKGTFYNLDTVDASAQAILQMRIHSIMCGETSE